MAVPSVVFGDRVGLSIQVTCQEAASDLPDFGVSCGVHRLHRSSERPLSRF